jgi:hypothetical protein
MPLPPHFRAGPMANHRSRPCGPRPRGGLPLTQPTVLYYKLCLLLRHGPSRRPHSGPTPRFRAPVTRNTGSDATRSTSTPLAASSLASTPTPVTGPSKSLALPAATFASESNCLVPRFFARYAEHAAEAEDAFTVPDWDRSVCPACCLAYRETLFAFPPPPLLNTFVAKARADGVRTIVLAPLAVTAPYWHKLLRASIVPDPKGYHRVRSSFALKDSDLPGQLALFAVDFANDTCRRRPGSLAAPLRFGRNLPGALPRRLTLRHGRSPAHPRRPCRRGLGAPPVTRTTATRRPGITTQLSLLLHRAPSSRCALHSAPSSRPIRTTHAWLSSWAPTTLGPHAHGTRPCGPCRGHSFQTQGHVPMVTLCPEHGPDPDAPKRPPFDHLVTSPRTKPAHSGPGPVPDAHGHVSTSRIGPVSPD